MKTYEITSQQISDLHNAMCYLRNVQEFTSIHLRETSSVNTNLERALKLIEPIRKQLMDIKDEEFDQQSGMYKRVGRNNGIGYSIWSMYEVDDMTQTSTVPAGAELVSSYTEKTVQVAGSTWIDLWKASDQLIKDADDTHIFIEGFEKTKDGKYKVVLGS